MTPVYMSLFRRMIALCCFVGAALIVITAGLPQRAAFTGKLNEGQLYTAPEINALAPDIQAKTLSGETVTLSQLRGKPVIVNFWATWCEPCRFEMPELQTLYEKYHARGLRVLGVNVGEPEALAKAWTSQLQLTFDIVMDEQFSIATDYALRGQPSTYIISPNGIITQIMYGATTHQALEDSISPFFDDPFLDK